MLDILIPIFYIIPCILLGLLVLKYIFKITINEQYPIYFTLSNAFLLGLGILTYILLCIGLLHIFSSLSLIIILIAIILLGIYLLKSDLILIKNQLLQPIKLTYSNHPSLYIIMFITTLITLITIEIRSIIFQPLGDSTAYYLILPKLIASSQYITELPGYEIMSRMSLFSEMHYAALISLGSILSAKIFIGIVFISALFILFQIGNKIKLNIFGKYLLIAILITSFTFTDLIFGATVDWFAAAFGLVAFYWALEFSDTENTLILVLVGLFSGFAVLGKLSYAYTFIPCIILLIFWKYLPNLLQSPKSIIKISIFFIIGVLIPISLNILKNFILFNQPFAPFFSPPEYSSSLYQIWYTPENAYWIIMTYPFSLTFGTYPMQGGTLSPLFLAFLPIIMLIKNIPEKPNFIKILTCSVIGIIISIIVTPYIFSPRYLMIPLLLLILIISKSTEYYISTHKIIKKIVVIFTIFVLLITLFSSLQTISSTIKQGECKIIGPICNGSQTLNSNADGNDKIYMLGYYSYWINESLLSNLSNTSERNYLEKTLTTPNDRIIYLQNNNYKYIFSDGSFSNATQNYLVINESEIIFSDNKVLIFKLNNLTNTL